VTTEAVPEADRPPLSYNTPLRFPQQVASVPVLTEYDPLTSVYRYRFSAISSVADPKDFTSDQCCGSERFYFGSVLRIRIRDPVSRIRKILLRISVPDPGSGGADPKDFTSDQCCGSGSGIRCCGSERFYFGSVLRIRDPVLRIRKILLRISVADLDPGSCVADPKDFTSDSVSDL
jgi:hypothetical protein